MVTDRGRLAECFKLSKEIERLAEMPDHYDPLFEYRKWWDDQGINSETDDGWPEGFCFRYENIHRFAKYWKGKNDE